MSSPVRCWFSSILQGEPLSIAPVPCTPCDERCSVQCTYCNVEVLYVVTIAIRLACSVSNMTRLLWSVHVHMVSALYRILTGSFCRLTLYGLFLPVRTRNALQKELTMAPLMLFLETIL